MMKRTRHKSFEFRNPTYWRGMLTGTAISTLTYLYYELYKTKVEIAEKDQKSNLLKQQELSPSDVTVQEKVQRGQAILKYGTPVVGQNLRFFANHVLVYDQQKKIPIWVAEHITANRLKGEANRKRVEFMPDPSVDPLFSAQNSDYKGSGWSRGHMSPAGNNRLTQKAMEESFYLSNIVPQNYQNNAGFWNRLEMFCRDLTKTFPSVYVFSGPLFQARVEEDGKKYIKYQVIGDNEVAVPSHLYKVIVVEDKKFRPFAMASFIVPNEPIGYSHHLKEYQVDLQDLEKIAGVKFVPELERKSVKNLCKATKCELIGRTEFELYFIGRKLDSASTLHRVENVWAELEEKHLTPDKYLIDLYAKKKQELSTGNENDRPS